MKSARFAWAVVALLLTLVLLQNRTAIERAFSPQDSGKHQREYLAWEKTAQSRYRQVKKNYYMDEGLCNNVIGVLNEMSTEQPPSNWVSPQTTNSTFECWPASVDPNDYYRKYSGHSDQPTAPTDTRK